MSPAPGPLREAGLFSTRARRVHWPRSALSQAWTPAEASLPPGWQLSGLWRFEDLWVT